jgi:hypothetical protein
VTRRRAVPALALGVVLLVLSMLGHPLLWEVPLAVLIGLTVALAVGSAHVRAVAAGFAAGAVAGLVAYTFTFGGPAEAFDSGLLEEGGLVLLVFGMALLGAAGAGTAYLVGHHRRRGR